MAPLANETARTPQSRSDVVPIKKQDVPLHVLWSQLPFVSSDFCDISFRCADGSRLNCHRLVISMASEAFRKVLTSDFAEVHNGEIAIEFSAGVIQAFLDVLYNGHAQISRALLPELLLFAHQWEVHIMMRSLISTLHEQMSAELCSELIVKCDLQLSSEMNRLLTVFASEHFVSCTMSSSFTSWPLHWMASLLQRDDLNARNEEQILQAVFKWHHGGTSRDEATTTLLQLVRFPLLSASTLLYLRTSVHLTGLPGIYAARLSEDAQNSHAGPGRLHRRSCKRPATPASQLSTRRRHSFGPWWADLGCSVKGGISLANLGDDWPWGVRLHAGAAFIAVFDADSQGPGHVLRQDVANGDRQRVAGHGSPTNGLHQFESISGIALDSEGGLYVLDGNAAVILCIRDGMALAVGGDNGRPQFQGAARGLHVGKDGALYFLDAGGARVCRYCDGATTVVAGQRNHGASAGELAHAEQLWVAGDGSVYVADTGNDRVQKWSPGAREGATVAGGRGPGDDKMQLHSPVGLCVTSGGTIYVADKQNHRVMKWRENWASGMVVAGGTGAGSGLGQLCAPTDVALDESHGALVIVDHGNRRVVRWAPEPLAL